MKAVQQALASLMPDVPVMAGVWRATSESQNPAEQYVVYSTTTTEAAAAEDFCRVSFEEDVPEPVRLACLLFVSYHYENRDIPDMTTYKSMRMAFEHLLYPHRDPAQMF